MATPNAQTTVGELVKDRPARSRVFETLKIDYCCGGKLPLAEVCAKRRLDTASVLEQLRQADTLEDRHAANYPDADEMTLTELADHIEQTHHVYLKQELPRLGFMTHKVATVHGEHEPRLHAIREIFVAFQNELASHMAKEEQVLFPMIRQLEQADGVQAFHCGSLANPIAQMEHEHDNAGGALEKLAELTDDFAPPEWACNTFRAMYDALRDLQQNMHQHVHKENNVLFLKALKLESERKIGEQA